MHTTDWKHGYQDGFNGCVCYEYENAEYMAGFECGMNAAAQVIRDETSKEGQ